MTPIATTLERPAVRIPSAAVLARLDIAVCRWCSDDLEHCHDALVVHAVGEVHCATSECATPAELHHLVIDCAEMCCDCESLSAT